jgi:signal transduction histidine kinase
VLETESEWSLVKVRDSGIGISSELLPRIFDLFMQGNTGSRDAKGGLGLGLALARRLVEMHGGTLNAWSEGLGKGSEFTMRMPAARPL